MTLVVDASVAAKWVLPEEGSDRAAALRASGEGLIAPDLIIAEVGNAAWKRARRNELLPEHAAEAIEIVSGLVTLEPLLGLADHALALAIKLDHPIYDCFYLALAQRGNAALVTADDRLLAVAKKAKIKARRL